MLGRTRRYGRFFSVILLLFISGLTCALAEDTSEEDAVIMEPIEVQGKRPRDPMTEPLSESPGLELSTSVVDQSDIIKQGSKTIIEALEYVPGAWIETRGRKVKQFFSVRGQKYPYPIYAIDGAWQREFDETPYFFSSANVERIEVIRSSAALLTGLTGLAGIVNIVPREYKEPEARSLMEYGTFDTYRFHLSQGATAGDVSYAISAGSDHTSGPENKHSAEAMTNFLGSIGWKPVKMVSVKANLFHLYGEQELTRAEPPATTRLQETNERFDPLQSTLFNVKADFRPNDKATTELLMHYVDRDHVFLNDTEDGHTSADEHDYEWGSNLIQSLAVSEKNTLRVGGYYNHWIAPDGKRFYTGRRCDLETFSAVVVDEHKFGNLSLDGGIRWAKTYINDYGAFNIDGSAQGFANVTPVVDEWEPSVFNGNFGAAYYFSRPVSLHLNLAAGQIQPRSGTLDINLQEPKNEMRIKMDLGVRAAKEKLGQASLVGFLTQQKDAIVLSGQTETVDEREMELYMNRDQDQVGVEFEARSVPLLNVVQPFVNVMAVKSRADSQGEMKRNTDLPQLIMAGGVYASRSNIDLNILWKYVSSYESTRFVAAPQGKSPEPQPLGDFNLLDANVGWSFGRKHHARIYLEVKNITDKKFSTVVGYPDFGRRFTVGIQQSFR